MAQRWEASIAAAGVICVAGSEPATLLTLPPDTGSALELHGDLTGELRRLSGARRGSRQSRQGWPG
jgi:hypothetical protein